MQATTSCRANFGLSPAFNRVRRDMAVADLEAREAQREVWSRKVNRESSFVPNIIKDGVSSTWWTQRMMGGGFSGIARAEGRKIVASVFVGLKADEWESDHASSFGTSLFSALTASSTSLPHAKTFTSSIHTKPQVVGVAQDSSKGAVRVCSLKKERIQLQAESGRPRDLRFVASLSV
ncbi:hypothetical protein JCM10021v2_004861 [Rhodotorula toruloides]